MIYIDGRYRYYHFVLWSGVFCFYCHVQRNSIESNGSKNINYDVNVSALICYCQGHGCLLENLVELCLQTKKLGVIHTCFTVDIFTNYKTRGHANLLLVS